VGTPFDEATTVVAAGDGRYTATLDEAWNLRPLPQGGIVTAIALRAMGEELGHPTQRLRTMHTTFVGQVPHGELEVDVEVLRRGRSMSHARAEIRAAGAGGRGHLVTAVFGDSRDGFDFTDVAPPAVDPPAACPSFRDPPPPGVPTFDPMPFWDLLLEGRPALGIPPWEDTPRTTSERASWYRFEETPWLDDGTVDPFALVVMADTMPGAVGQRVGPDDRPWFGPSVDLTVHVLAECRSPWVLAHNTARFAGDGYASADMALWDCGPDGDGATEPRLVAYGTQVLFFTFLSPPPDP
jgi:acyl-CoA thioesterase